MAGQSGQALAENIAEEVLKIHCSSFFDYHPAVENILRRGDANDDPTLGTILDGLYQDIYSFRNGVDVLVEYLEAKDGV